MKVQVSPSILLCSQPLRYKKQGFYSQLPCLTWRYIKVALITLVLFQHFEQATSTEDNTDTTTAKNKSWVSSYSENLKQYRLQIGVCRNCLNSKLWALGGSSSFCMKILSNSRFWICSDRFRSHQLLSVQSTHKSFDSIQMWNYRSLTKTLVFMLDPTMICKKLSREKCQKERIFRVPVVLELSSAYRIRRTPSHPSFCLSCPLIEKLHCPVFELY